MGQGLVKRSFTRDDCRVLDVNSPIQMLATRGFPLDSQRIAMASVHKNGIPHGLLLPCNLPVASLSIRRTTIPRRREPPSLDRKFSPILSTAILHPHPLQSAGELSHTNNIYKGPISGLQISTPFDEIKETPKGFHEVLQQHRGWNRDSKQLNRGQSFLDLSPHRRPGPTQRSTNPCCGIFGVPQCVCLSLCLWVLVGFCGWVH